LRLNSILSWRVQAASTNGPAPIGLASKACWPACSAAGEAIQFSDAAAMLSAKVASWVVSVKSSVRASVAVVLAIRLPTRADCDPSAGSLIRSQLNLTAAASSGVPSENFTPSLRVNVQLVPPSEVVRSSARP
jgi:hypothetical protein